MVSLGGAFSVLSAIAVLAVGNAVHAIDATALGKDTNSYLFDHPARLLGAVILVDRRAEAVFKPGRDVWQEMFWWGRDSPTDVTTALVELRDGRRIAGVLGTFTAPVEDNRSRTRTVRCSPWRIGSLHCESRTSCMSRGGISPGPGS